MFQENKTKVDWWNLLMTNEEFKKDFISYNKSIANSLHISKEQGHNVIGREEEIERLRGIMERPLTPVAILIGQAGTGKTALVQEFAKQSKMHDYVILSLRLGTLSALETGKLKNALANILNHLKVLQTKARRILNNNNFELILFIDEIHMIVTIFGAGTKIGGDVLKDILTKPPIKVIGATTQREYDSTIATDKPLAERFKQIEIKELPKNVILKICKDWWKKQAGNCPIPSDSLIELILNANANFRADSAEPRKSIDVLEDLVSHSKRHNFCEITESVINQIFKSRYSINLAFSQKLDPNELYEKVSSRVLGQPHAMYQMKRMIRSLLFNLDENTNKPLATLLLCGPTASGKTETVKALADALYPNEPTLFFINMPDYKTKESEKDFRKKLGEYVRHTPNAIVLLDEFEKADDSIKDSMLGILDEGIVYFDTKNREGNYETNFISLRNTIIICTTNAGHEVFAVDGELGMRNSIIDETTLNAEIESLLKALRTNLLANGFKAEMLGRFNRIIPYRSLTDKILLSIADREILKLVDKFKRLKDIEIELNPIQEWDKGYFDSKARDVSLYITLVRAKADDTNAGGARAIKREIENCINDSIVDAIIDNPGCKRFKLEISKDTQIYNSNYSKSQGGVKVVPIQTKKVFSKISS